jgi:amino-acid N-acetyltransferase
MTDTSITLQQADADDLDLVEELLDANDLPHRDVREKPGRFFVGSVDGTLVGVGGIEACGEDGLLRSVVVEESVRGAGYGTALCDELEAQAAADGIDALYLLTTTAAGFFEARGYEAIDRNEAPPLIRQTTEFEDLCPASATCMKKSLRSTP